MDAFPDEHATARDVGRIITSMRVDVRQPDRTRVGRLEVDPAARPTRARTIDTDREVFLEWEAATDDAGRLRRCVVCGCRDLYSVRTFPQLTGFVVVLAFAGAALGILGGGLAENPLVLAALVIVLVLDVASLVFRRFRLVCYQCRTSYREIEVARQHRPWDRAVAARHARDSNAQETSPDDGLRRDADSSVPPAAAGARSDAG